MQLNYPWSEISIKYKWRIHTSLFRQQLLSFYHITCHLKLSHKLYLVERNLFQTSFQIIIMLFNALVSRQFQNPVTHLPTSRQNPHTTSLMDSKYLLLSVIEIMHIWGIKQFPSYIYLDCWIYYHVLYDSKPIIKRTLDNGSRNISAII